jgi:phage terminase small subunit
LTDLDEAPGPPFDLSLQARRHWDRIASQLVGQGRWETISPDLLASFCQVLALSQEVLSQIITDGVVVPGSRSDRDRVRHPLWSAYNGLHQSLIRYARTIPLTNPSADVTGAAIDSWIGDMMAVNE